jgi:hypothetical protein
MKYKFQLIKYLNIYKTNILLQIQFTQITNIIIINKGLIITFVHPETQL